jgi:hypothetical protein
MHACMTCACVAPTDQPMLQQQTVAAAAEQRSFLYGICHCKPSVALTDQPMLPQQAVAAAEESSLLYGMCLQARRGSNRPANAAASWYSHDRAYTVMSSGACVVSSRRKVMIIVRWHATNNLTTCVCVAQTDQPMLLQQTVAAAEERSLLYGMCLSTASPAWLPQTSQCCSSRRWQQQQAVAAHTRGHCSMACVCRLQAQRGPNRPANAAASWYPNPTP